MANPISFTYPEVFIIESLNLEDEAANRFEGKVLADILRMCGKEPKYFYFRTKDELVMLSQLFRESDYRFLHVSCHGNAASISTTLDDVSYIEFSNIFENNLRNRRLFVSACELGNELFSTVVFGKNKGMYSVAGPVDKIAFSEAVGFWGAFYTKIFAENGYFVKNVSVRSAMQSLCNLYKMKFHWSWHNTYHRRYEHEIIHNLSLKEIVGAGLKHKEKVDTAFVKK